MLKVLVLFIPLLAATGAFAGDDAGWDRAAAASYLDSRRDAWLQFQGADRGRDADKTSCVSCHSLLPYTLATAAAHRRPREGRAWDADAKVLDQVSRRVAHRDELDSPRFGLAYDFDEAKKRESRGTEAVLNALILATADCDRGLTRPSVETLQAFEGLWTTQLDTGPDRGAWEWLDFGLAPWESADGRFFGATLAAIAVGTAPGYHGKEADVKLQSRVGLLRDYLRAHAAQSLHHRAWLLWASAKVDGVLNEPERDALVGELFAKQQPDGGWGLASLGDYTRSDGTAQPTTADGYATGLIVHALRQAGLPKDHPGVAKGLAWLRSHQQPTGAWASESVNKKRNPETHVGRFMSDAATAFAVLALDE